MFVADITEIVITGLNADATRLVVESWNPVSRGAEGRAGLARTQPARDATRAATQPRGPANRARRASSVFSNFSRSAVSTLVAPSSEMRMSRAIRM